MTATLAIISDTSTKNYGSDELPKKSRLQSRMRSLAIFYVLVIMSAGALLVAIGFAASRAGDAHANVFYWLGQFLVFAAPTLYLLIKNPDRRQAILLVAMIALVTYTITQSYSPIQFKFLDEFQHFQTARAILHTHHLFASNTSLPVSPYFPGLEIATTALVQLSHLSIYAAGTIVIGIAHILTAIGLYLLVVEIHDRPRLAALAVVIYSTEPHYQFFDSYFTYETIAMPFLIVTLLFFVKMIKATDVRIRTTWTVSTIFMAFVTVVSHHVTSYVLVIFVGILTVVEVIRRRQMTPAYWHAGVVTLLILGIVIGWDFGVAQGVLHYLEPAAHSITGTSSAGTQQLSGGNHVSQTGLLRTPWKDAVAEYAATGLLLVLVSIGSWLVWRNRKRYTGIAQLGLLVLSISVYVLVLLRLATSDGSELAGRSYSFAMIPGSVAVAFVLLALVSNGSHAATRGGGRSRNAVQVAVGILLMIVLAFGGIAGGWPIYYARLPGPFLASAWERSVDSHNLLAANWAAHYLPERAGVASSWTTGGLLGTLGDMSNVPGTADLFLTTRFTPELRTIVTDRRVRYVAIDSRILNDAPQNGAFFDDDPHAGNYTGGLERPAYLDKFSATPGVSEIYSDGTVSIYDLLGSEYKH
jgi:hypothetical protein